MTRPRRGEIWLVNLDPARGREQAGKRPALVISVDGFNFGPAGLAVVIPITSKDKHVPLHVRVDPPEAGLRETSFIKTDDVRSVSHERLIRRWGRVSSATITRVEDRLRILMGL